MIHKINLWRLTFFIVVPVALVILLWGATTLPIDKPRLFLRLTVGNIVIIPYAIFHSYKALMGSRIQKNLIKN